MRRGRTDVIDGVGGIRLWLVGAPGRDMRSDRGEGGGHCRTPRSQTSVPAGMRALCRLRPSRGRGCEVSACLPMAMTSRDVARSCPCRSAALPSPKRAPRGLGPGRASWRDRGLRGDASLPCVASRVRGRSAAGSTISVDGRPGNRIHVRSGCRCALCRRRTWMGPGIAGRHRHSSVCPSHTRRLLALADLEANACVSAQVDEDLTDNMSYYGAGVPTGSPARPPGAGMYR